MKAHQQAQAQQRRAVLHQYRRTMPPIWRRSTRTPYLPTVDSRPLGVGHVRMTVRDAFGRYVEL